MDFNDILEMVVEKKASDLFITADIPPSIKVHGRVMPVSKTRLDASQSRELTLGLMTPEQRDRLRRRLQHYREASPEERAEMRRAFRERRDR